MAYRKPAVTVIQEFVGLVPALAQFALPTCAVGAVYQIIDDDLVGTYSGVQQTYAYASLLAGADVDLEELASDDPYPLTKKPIETFIKDALVQILTTQTTGVLAEDILTDQTATIFANVQAGDKITFVETLGATIVAAVTDGVADFAANPDVLTAGTADLFANAKVGDDVIITGGANITPGTYQVLAKIDDDNIQLSANFITAGTAADVAYSITGDRGVNNQGAFNVKSKTDDNTLVLEYALPDSEGPIEYSITREVDEIAVSRVDALPGNGFEADESGITLPAGLLYAAGTESFEILEGNVEASYRALRNDMAANVREFERLSDVQAFFGIDQITPANPLAFGLNIMLQNTVTAVNGLGLDDNGVTDETLSFTSALDVLALTEMYALVPLTQSPVVHQLFKTHVEQLSQPQNKKERVAIINRTLITQETIIEEADTEVAESGARIIVNTQTDGVHDGAALANLNDVTLDAFVFVEKGDTVVITAGTDVAPGSYGVDTVTDGNNIILDADFVLVGGGASDITYFIIRHDGLGADGITFYDRNGTFISDGAAPGYYLVVSAPEGLVVGEHRISGLVSEKSFEVDQVPGITSLQSGLTYEVVRELSRTEQATAIAGYSEAFGSRRVVHTWPDVLEAPVGQDVEKLPGFYGGAAIGALTTGLPTQQGFTNLTISGFLGFDNSTGYFSDGQLDTMADGGTFIFEQAGEEQPLYIRHQLTTDRSSIKFQEFSVTKNVDFIAKFLRDAFSDFIGIYNIVDTTLDELKTVAKAAIVFLTEDTRLPRIGGVVRGGSLVLIEESETQIDTINMRFAFDIPIPLNNLDITIQV